ncbi:hypothetical protein [Amycolatopsis sp. FDAARGOS 1241]|uniref:hypothetical protein n=1 Tax=Amycolatopsis sp. FDAARGOS 1241 TaxID=2778070 RepID=UPI00194F1595|nr:hypothetical protein [Amycolatopsis sp. FDAARGOS 1241]QRP47624.1 hypothetical protein I6J71_06690 [Amycolatopsis sp. FDAARGOS 1241]
MAQQWVLACERGLVGLATEAGAVVRDVGDRRRDDVDDFAGGFVDQFELTTLCP